jgi:hypothetical protein
VIPRIPNTVKPPLVSGTIVLAHRFLGCPKVETTMRHSLKGIAAGLALTAALVLAACGTTPGERAVTGGLLGAGAGAAIGSVTGSAGKGAVIGGVAGAITGAVTDPCTLNLGDPYWKERSREEYYERCGHH